MSWHLAKNSCHYLRNWSSMSNTPGKLSQFVWGTSWFDLIPTASIRTTGSQDPWNNDTWTFLILKTWQQTSVDSYDSCRFDRIKLNRQHFQPTLYSPPEVKICEIVIHEPSSFVKRGHKLQLIHMIHVNSIELSWIDNIFNPPYIVQGRYIF